MYAEVRQQAFRLHQHIEQVADGGTLVAADVGDARLQQCLGHCQDALAVEGIAGAEPKALDLLVRMRLQPSVRSSRPDISLTRNSWMTVGIQFSVPGIIRALP